MSNRKAMVILLTVGFIKNIFLQKMTYFPEPHTHRKNKLVVEFDLSNYVTKSDLKSPTGVDTVEFAKRSDLTSLKSDTGKLDIDKLEKVANDLSS